MRLLIAIGCDTYVDLPSLRGAELDARRFHEMMTRQDIGDYDATKSPLILSPCLSTFRRILEDTFTSAKDRIDTFTFFFAGHGAMKAGSYYMCLSDSRRDLLSSSAFSMSALFSILNEIRPKQSNLILDTCQGGGIVVDLHAIIKPEIMGGAETPGVSIFVSSAADQYASDDSLGGLGTINLMRCIDGTAIVQTTRSTMDLLEVGRAASLRMANEYPDQTPLLWGLNLYGEARFCKNPHYGGINPAVTSLPQVTAGAETFALIKDKSADIWSEYFSIVDNFNPRRLMDVMAPVVSALSDTGGGAGAFAHGLVDACAFRAIDSPDVFRPVEVTAACIAGVLEQSGRGDVDGAILEMTARLLDMNCQALGEISRMLKDERYSLLSERGGFGDLFYLPLRLCRTLGWLGAQHFIRKWSGIRGSISEEEMLNRIVDQIFQTYSSSLIALSEVQSPSILTFLSCCREREWNDVAETMIGHMFNNFVASGGNIARADMDTHRALEFLMRRLHNKYSDAFDMFSHPGEMLASILLASKWFDLDDVIDPHLHTIDHYSFNVFHPNDHRRFARSTIFDGMNHTYAIGEGVWSTQDFYEKWRGDCVPRIIADTQLRGASVKTGALLAALLFPDRCPWFVAVATDANVTHSDEPF